MTIEQKLFTRAELEQQGFRELQGTGVLFYDIFYKGDLAINRERFMFGRVKGNNGDEPRYRFITEYKV